MVALQHFVNVAVTPLDHSVGLRRFWWVQSVFIPRVEQSASNSYGEGHSVAKGYEAMTKVSQNVR